MLNVELEEGKFQVMAHEGQKLFVFGGMGISIINHAMPYEERMIQFKTIFYVVVKLMLWKSSYIEG
jgi:hypothetical protein